METSNSYCNFAYNQKEDNIHKLYHDTQYGFPIHSDNELFGRLILEINQAGLSWDIILKCGFDHVYRTSWFVSFILSFGISLLTCTVIQQIPSLKIARRCQFF